MINPFVKQIGHIEDRVVEECGEVIQELSKAKRFGYFNFHPKDRPHLKNWERIAFEINDLKIVLEEYEKFLIKLTKQNIYDK